MTLRNKQILCMICEYQHLDTFLQFDVEIVYGSGISFVAMLVVWLTIINDNFSA